MKIKSLLVLIVIFLTISVIAFAKTTSESSLKLEGTELKTPKIAKDNNKNLTVNQEETLEQTLKEVETYMNAARKWEKLKCIPKTNFICTKRECLKKNIFVWLILDKNKGTVSRCEGQDRCYTYEANFSQSGVNINIQGKDPIGSMVKVLGDNRYKEIATIGLDAYISNGECEVID
jgi:hypothetical protein